MFFFYNKVSKPLSSYMVQHLYYGHKEGPKNQKIPVGPQSHPWILPGSKTPGQKGLVLLFVTDTNVILDF